MKKFIVLVLIFFCSINAFSIPFSDFVDFTSQKQAEKGLESSSNDVLKLSPKHSVAQKIANSIAKEKPSIIVECLYFLPFKTNTDKDRALLASYNTLRAVRSMESIIYYSASRNKMRPLYNYSSIIKSELDKTEIEDKDFVEFIPRNESLFARQDDSSFGDNLYIIKLQNQDDYIVQETTNLTTLSIAFIPAVKEKEVNVRMLVIACDEGLIFYAISSAKANLIRALETRVEESFTNRAKGAWTWFKTGVEQRLQ